MRTSQTISSEVSLHRCGHGADGAAAARGGFTLAEMIIVVLVIALMASATGKAMYGTYKRALVEKAAKGVYLSARYARLLAVEKQTQCCLMLDEEGRSYCLALGAVDSERDEGSQKLIADAYAKPTQFGGEVIFEQIKIASSYQVESEADEETTITFYPDGTADTAAVQIGDGSSHYAVYVLAATGKAQVRFGEATEAPVEVVDLDLEDQ